MPRVGYRHRTTATAAVVLAVGVAAAGVAGCSGTDGDPAAGQRSTLAIGLITPETGPFKNTGTEIVNGFQLYLDLHGGRLGGHPVKLIVADEGDGRQTAANSARKLVERDRVSALVGTLNGEATLSVRDVVAKAKVPFVGTGGRPAGLTDLGSLWYTSWLAKEPAAATAEHLRGAVDGPVYVMGADYQGAHENIAGFTETFTTLGGRIANDGGRPVWTPWPAQSVNYQPYFNKVAASGAKALYTFYTGTEAIDFVRQYAQSQLRTSVPLYGAGFLTDEGLLATQGATADGVQTTLNYAPDLSTPANQAFVSEFVKRFGTTPRLLNVTSYDAAAVLDRAIGAAGPDPGREAINAQIATIGAVDSPRGSWRWSVDHTPVQTWYLRQVGVDGRGRANLLVKSLATLGRAG